MPCMTPAPLHGIHAAVGRERKALQARADELAGLLEQQHHKQQEALRTAAQEHGAALKAAHAEAADARSVLVSCGA